MHLVRNAFSAAHVEPALTAVLGIGAPSGDDRAGWLAIEAFDAAMPPAECAALGITARALDRPGAALLDHLHGVRCAVLIDALYGGAAPGTLVRVRHAGLQADTQRATTHGFGVADALALGAQLALLPPQLELIGIEGESFAPAAPVNARVRRAAALLGRELARRLRAEGRRH
jgi:hydrogenase maturation protease